MRQWEVKRKRGTTISTSWAVATQRLLDPSENKAAASSRTPYELYRQVMAVLMGGAKRKGKEGTAVDSAPLTTGAVPLRAKTK